MWLLDIYVRKKYIVVYFIEHAVAFTCAWLI